MDRFGKIENTAIEEVRSWDQGRITASLKGPSDTHEGPVIMAAELQDSSRLASLLERAQLLGQNAGSQVALNIYPEPSVGWSMESPTPLLRAIEKRRPENVRLLMQHGAHSNGVLQDTQVQLERIYRRFTTRPDPHPASLSNDITMGGVGTVASHLIPITDGELKERRDTVCQLWTEHHRTGIDYSSESAQPRSAVRAGASTPEILDLLLEYCDDDARHIV